MSIEGVKEDTDNVTPAGDHVVCWHEVKGYNGQNYSRISLNKKITIRWQYAILKFSMKNLSYQSDLGWKSKRFRFLAATFYFASVVPQYCNRIKSFRTIKYFFFKRQQFCWKYRAALEGCRNYCMRNFVRLTFDPEHLKIRGKIHSTSFRFEKCCWQLSITPEKSPRKFLLDKKLSLKAENLNKIYHFNYCSKVGHYNFNML